MSTPSWFLIVNPNAGHGLLKPQRWPQLKQQLQQSGIEFEAAVTEYSGHAVTLVQQALVSGFRHFAVIGGDGTLNEVINGLFQQQQIDPCDCHLTALPWGTGNDWAAYYQLPRCIHGFINMLRSPAYKKQDIGRIHYALNQTEQQHFFLNFVGCGFDSYMLAQMGSGKGGRYRYLLYVLKCLKTYTSPRFLLRFKQHSSEHLALMLMASLGRYGGAGMILAPDAEIDDGLLDIMCINDMPVWKRAASLP